MSSNVMTATESRAAVVQEAENDQFLLDLLGGRLLERGRELIQQQVHVLRARPVQELADTVDLDRPAELLG